MIWLSGSSNALRNLSVRSFMLPAVKGHGDGLEAWSYKMVKPSDSSLAILSGKRSSPPVLEGWIIRMLAFMELPLRKLPFVSHA